MKKYLRKIINKQDLTEKEASNVLELIMTGKINDIEISAFLSALSMKGESIEEIIGMVKVMRKHMNKVPVAGKLLDTCGTGGDGIGTINVSTAAAIVCAAAGVKVAKHGNKAASSKSGSADVLESLGVNINLDPKKVKKCIEEIGIGFMFAPIFHPAMKYVAPVRKTLEIRTIFNFLGPLANPVNAKYQVIGVSDKIMAPKLGRALMKLGSEKVIIVYSADGLDEVSVSDLTHVYEYTKSQAVKEYAIKPSKIYNINNVKGGDAHENAKIIKDIFDNKEQGAKKDFVIANAAIGLLAYGAAKDLEQGKNMAKETIENGKAKKKLEQLIKITNRL